MDFCKWLPSERLLGPLLDMLVDGKFDLNDKTVIKVPIIDLWVHTDFLVH